MSCDSYQCLLSLQLLISDEQSIELPFKISTRVRSSEILPFIDLCNIYSDIKTCVPKTQLEFLFCVLI